MSSIITGILKSTIGLLFNKARDCAANKLKDGDLADEKLRQVLVKDLTDIKSKLDCLSLKDLDASYSFLKEGVGLLNLALDKVNGDQNPNIDPTADEATKLDINDTASGAINAVLFLPQVIQKLKISCGERFVSAKECFKASRERATDAFNNKSLSISDRIVACKFRVAARILESGLEDPVAATTACLTSLEELHGLPQIQEIFAVFLKGGIKSKFKETERLKTMMSVLFINHAVFKFASKYSGESLLRLSWPRLELVGQTFHPVLNALEFLMKAPSNEEFLPQLDRVVTHPRISSCVRVFAVNRLGEIILLTDDKITVIHSTGDSRDVIFPELADYNVLVEQMGKAVAVDSEDNVYVVTWFEARGENATVKEDFVLYIFDKNYNIKFVSFLDFRNAGKCKRVNIAIDRDQNLIMLTNWNKQVYVCDNTGQIKLKFKRDGESLRSIAITNENDIAIVSNNRSAVQTYSADGAPRPIVKVPDDHEALQVAFHHGICKTVVLTYVWKQDAWFLLSYSSTGHLDNSVYLRKRDAKCFWSDIFMTSHPSEPFAAVLMTDNITLI
jgi:hypothetical protein